MPVRIIHQCMDVGLLSLRYYVSGVALILANVELNHLQIAKYRWSRPTL